MIRLLFRWAAYTTATGLILLALLVGIARLLLPLAPEYQDNIRNWASAATGFNVDFRGIGASWPLGGPTLQFSEVAVKTRDGAYTVLEADELTVNVSLFQLLTQRVVLPRRVGLREASIELERTPDGQLLVQGRPLTDFMPGDSDVQVKKIVVDLRDIRIEYIHSRARQQRLSMAAEQLEFDVRPERIGVAGELQLPERAGGRVELDVEIPRQAGDGTMNRTLEAYIDGENLNLSLLASYLLDMETPLRAGRGDMVAWLRLAEGRPSSVATDIEWTDVAIGDPDGLVTLYDSIQGRFEWEQESDGWVLSANDFLMLRAGESWPVSDLSLDYRSSPSGDVRRFRGRANFARLHDLYPIVSAIVSSDVRETLLPADVRGDLRDLELAVELTDDSEPDYELSLEFEQLGIGLPGTAGSTFGWSGTLAGDRNGGRLQLSSDGAELTLPDVFIDTLAARRVDGFLIWRVTGNAIRVLSDQFRIVSADFDASTRFELSMPREKGSPFLDLQMEVDEATAGVWRYLPLRKLPQGVTDWLENAIVAGRLANGELEFRGPLAEFPYDQGEGRFRIDFDVVDGVLEYAPDWPRLENLSAHMVFDGVEISTRRNSGRIAGLALANQEVVIPDMRKGVINVLARQTLTLDQMLTLLSAVPVTEPLKPTLARIRGAGNLEGRLDLSIPALDLANYRMNIDLETRDTNVALDGMTFGLEGVQGRFRVNNTRVSADGVTASLLGEPVGIRIRPSASDGSLYSHYALVEGATPIRKWFDELNLAGAESMSGMANWTAMAMVPVPPAEERAAAPLRLLVRADLEPVFSGLPAPLAKAAGDPESLDIDLQFPADGVIKTRIAMQRDLHAMLRLESDAGEWFIERGAVHAGRIPKELPAQPGVEISGQVEQLRFEDWLDLQTEESEARWDRAYREAVLDIERLSILGQLFRNVEVQAQRSEAGWAIELQSEGASGTIAVPLEPTADSPLRIDLTRLALNESDDQPAGESDPRGTLPMQINVADFSMGDMQFGKVSAEIRSVPDGLVAGPISAESESFNIVADGAWLVESNRPEAQQSRLRLELTSNDVKKTLVALGYSPVLEGDQGSARADIRWPGPPGADFLDYASGEFQVRMDRGALLDVEPGGGRLLGVLSVAALPRRLSLDFSDVFDEGLAFESLKGDFNIDDGNAYTCNLGIEGPVANLGMVGRAGLRDEDYDQVAVVRPDVSSVIALGGAVVGGPGVGAAMLLISQLFKKPLSTLGESYYSVSGSWENPAIDRIQRTDVDTSRFRNCEQYLLTQAADRTSRLEALPESERASPQALPESPSGPQTDVMQE